MMIKTERIKIFPASREQMEKIIQAEKDDELKKAYGEIGEEGPRFIVYKEQGK